MFSYVRAQEDQADRAGVKFLTATGQSAKGMYETFKRLADQLLYQFALHQSLHAVAPDAGRARGGARGDGKGKPVLGPQGSAGAAVAP